MSEADANEEDGGGGLRVTVMHDEALIHLFDTLRAAGQAEGHHEAYIAFLTMLSEMKQASEEELGRNEKSAIALAHVMLLAKMIARLAPLASKHEKRAERHLAVLRDAFVKMGFIDEEDEENEQA